MANSGRVASALALQQEDHEFDYLESLSEKYFSEYNCFLPDFKDIQDCVNCSIKV